jgi:flagellar basal-body rod protein FlgF
VATGIDLSPGVTVPTERQLDVALPNDTFLAVRTAAGTPAYTRNGHIEVGPEGEFSIAGNALLDNLGRPLSVPPGAVSRVIENGSLVADNEIVGQLGLVELNGPLERSGPTLFSPGQGATVTVVDDPNIRVGALELGNAPPLEAAIQMISAQRQYDTAMQAIETYRKLDQRAMEVGRVR